MRHVLVVGAGTALVDEPELHLDLVATQRIKSEEAANGKQTQRKLLVYDHFRKLLA